MDSTIALSKIKKFTDQIASRLSKLDEVSSCEAFHWHTIEAERLEIHIYVKEDLTFRALCLINDRLARLFKEHVHIQISYAPKHRQYVICTQLPKHVLEEKE